ncbi:hypothetical protein SAMN00808754_1700 [Thermanaeromonas toyohensis ToBE]|uniref:Uncharacterized protein n=1 Tax=Thermanaeromonas toyohensis ToBE TaxID=698762 RepID=A0A1W1VU46_9FIRM|nr:hypothetical protein SAMN00808754_1700 [Thermanaeromonas toyohensis ToBE]
MQGFYALPPVPAVRGLRQGARPAGAWQGGTWRGQQDRKEAPQERQEEGCGCQNIPFGAGMAARRQVRVPQMYEARNALYY